MVQYSKRGPGVWSLANKDPDSGKRQTFAAANICLHVSQSARDLTEGPLAPRSQNCTQDSVLWGYGVLCSCWGINRVHYCFDHFFCESLNLPYSFDKTTRLPLHSFLSPFLESTWPSHLKLILFLNFLPHPYLYLNPLISFKQSIEFRFLYFLPVAFWMPEAFTLFTKSHFCSLGHLKINIF